MPAGPAPQTLTFLFTDLEGSTRLWERHPVAMRSALARHDALLGAAVTEAGGQVLKSTGDGLMAVFGSAAGGLAACLAAQRALAAEPWGETGALRVRMGLHTGEAQTRAGDYFGPAVNRSARIMAAGHGGQVLLSATAAGLVADDLPDGATLVDLGAHRLKDLGRPEHLFQLAHPALGNSFPPLATLDRRPNNLPTQTSTFIAREAELGEVRARIEAAPVRLLTLMGPGGTGKTRLALRAAADEIDQFSDGVYFVDLAPVREPEAVLAGIARTVGVNQSGGRPLLEELGGQLASRTMLLVLDNFEQVTAAGPTVAELLAACPGLKFLVTSREALHVRGEQLYPVPPLPLPDPERPTAAELADCGAVQLFVERAQAVRPDFTLTDDNAPAVAEICRRLDGLPLAIELATARLNLFSPAALRDRLGHRLRLLKGGGRDLPARQQTLRATIEWSYQLLDADERRLFELLSVFSGAALDAVEAVAGQIDGLDEADVVDGLASLLDKSLVRQDEPDRGEPRLLMLETIREYAAERLDEHPELAAAAHTAHAVYFADFARRQWRDLTGSGRERALDTMAAELDNLRQAWRHWVAERDLERLDRLVDSLWLLYDARGWYHDTIGLTSDLLDILPSAPPDTERARQEITLRLALAKALLATKGYSEEVEQAYARALEPFRGQEVPQLFPVLRSLASFYLTQGDFDKTYRAGAQILRLAEREGDTAMLVEGHLVMGATGQPSIKASLAHLETALTLFRSGPYQARTFRLGNNPGVACLTTSGFFLWTLGYPDQALERAREALALADELHHPYTTAYAFFHAGMLHLWLRQPDALEQRALALIQAMEHHDFPIWRALGSCLLGTAEIQLGRPEEGLARLNQGIARYQELKTPPVFWPLLRSVQAAGNAFSGRVADGLTLIDEALDLAERRRDPISLAEFNLLKGDITGLAGGDPEPWYRKSLAAAQAEGARMTMLRVHMRLHALGAPGAERDLRGIYDSFTEGFATADLTEARALLGG